MADEKIANRTAVALGNFDGMHVGHMAVLRAAKGFESKGLTPLALLFDEHSLKAITGTAPPMLMTADERNRIIAENGLKIKTIVFNEIKDLSPQDFVEKILAGRFGARAVCCGYNYRFGKNASGNAQTMKEICDRLGLECRIAGEVDVDSRAASSTEIRKFIESGEIEKANAEAPDAASASFGRLMGEILVYREDRWSDTLRRMGDALGRFIYIMDACVDLDGDTFHERYNPFRRYYGLDNERRFRDILKMLLGECIRYFDVLPLVQDADILKNILCSGLWAEFDKKYNKKGPSDVSGSV